jgi:hypothetical protein
MRRGFAVIVVGLAAAGVLIALGYDRPPETAREEPERVSEETPQVEGPPEREPVVLTGTGQQVTETVDLAPGLYTVRMEHFGPEGSFRVRMLDGSGERVGPLYLTVQSGEADVSAPVRVEAEGPHLFEVGARGDWRITLE